jgi:hypothetical protein
MRAGSTLPKTKDADQLTLAPRRGGVAKYLARLNAWTVKYPARLMFNAPAQNLLKRGYLSLELNRYSGRSFVDPTGMGWAATGRSVRCLHDEVRQGGGHG